MRAACRRVLRAWPKPEVLVGPDHPDAGILGGQGGGDRRGGVGGGVVEDEDLALLLGREEVEDGLGTAHRCRQQRPVVPAQGEDRQAGTEIGCRAEPLAEGGGRGGACRRLDRAADGRGVGDDGAVEGGDLLAHGIDVGA